MRKVELFRDHAVGWPEGANAEASHLVHDPRPLSDEILPLAVRPPAVLFLSRWDRRHAAMALLATQPAEKGTHNGIEAISLRAPVLARHRDALGMDHVGLDFMPPQPAR